MFLQRVWIFTSHFWGSWTWKKIGHAIEGIATALRNVFIQRFFFAKCLVCWCKRPQVVAHWSFAELPHWPEKLRDVAWLKPPTTWSIWSIREHLWVFVIRHSTSSTMLSQAERKEMNLSRSSLWTVNSGCQEANIDEVDGFRIHDARENDVFWYILRLFTLLPPGEN